MKGIATAGAENAVAIPDEGTHKVAALLLAMGKPQADRVLKYFSEQEIRKLVEATVSLGTVPRERVEQFVADMVDAVDRGTGVRAGIDEIEKMLAGVLQPEQVAVIMSGLKSDAQKSVWLKLAEIPETTLTQFLLKEHPQTVAFILAKTGAGTAAAVVRQMPAGMRSEILRRLLALRRVTDAAMNLIEEGIEEELLRKVSKDSGPAIHARVADIINKMDRQQMEEILSDLEAHRPKDAKLVKGLLFTFDDVARLTPADRVKLFDAVPADRTIIALHGASATLSELVLSSVASRSRRMIEQEVASGSNVPPREVFKARRAIADLALEMAERGQIDIAQNQDA